MKTFLQFFLTVLLLIAVPTSCKNSKTKTENRIITFDLKELPEPATLKLSDLGATDIQYIPLETTGQSVIPGIRNIIRSKSFFLTHYSTNINMFRHDGSFVTKIGTIGRGPNEFTLAHDVDVDPKSESVYLADGWQQKFLVFSKNGELVRTFKSPQAGAVNFRLTDDGILIYYSNPMGTIENSFILLDTAGNIIKNFPNKYPWKRTIPNVAFLGENLFYRFNNQLFKKEIYCDTIYVFEDKDFKPHLTIDAGKLRITPEIRTEATAEFIMQNFLHPMNLFEFADYIYYEFVIPRNGRGEGLSFIGSKKDNFRALFDPEKDLINDLDGGPVFWSKTIWDDNTLVSWIDALKLKTWVSSEDFKNSTPKYPQKKKELEKLAENLKETDNPVLILVKIK
ncbi:MAG TPA: 6-bladed beta-propeller [Bacteroidales bacterium]|nr:6-bladed beta-propeller [Bacteroidales bacterium]HCI55163.1 hypothetical protein [Bacteroidales bacterium]HRC90245.1 6-bladed beta-propeller [Bacteroidales bacterium]